MTPRRVDYSYDYCTSSTYLRKKNIWYTAYFNNWIIYRDRVTKHLYLQGQSHKSSLNIYEGSLTKHISSIYIGTVSQNISPVFT